MTALPERAPRNPIPSWGAWLAMLWVGWTASASWAQTLPVENPPLLEQVGDLGLLTPPPATSPAPAANPASSVDPIPTAVDPPASAPFGGIALTGCSSCSQGLMDSAPPWPPPYGSQGCTPSPCVPGRQLCHPCMADTKFGRALCALYECICCPDPCYEPRWTPVSDSAFFVDAPRPRSQMRLRWDYGIDLILPDRSEYFWPRADGSGKGPKPVAPFKVEPRIKYNELSLYTEAGTGGFSMITEFTYLSLENSVVPDSSGFGDMMIGTKSLLFDCELIQLAFQMKTFIQMGNFLEGLGTGHFSLEPSLLMGVKLTPETYLELQLAEWIPIAGDSGYMGCVGHAHMSLNQVLFRPLPDVPIVGTLEINSWLFQDGAYTDPILGANQKSSGEAYVMPGFGLRMFVCDKFDFGFGAAFAVTQRHFANELYRTEIRFRF